MAHVHFDIEDTDETITMDGVPVPPIGGEVHLDDKRYEVRNVVLSYWTERPESVTAHVRIKSRPESTGRGHFV